MSELGEGSLNYSVAGAANRVGLSPATVRTWDHRYGLSPSVRTNGGHRRYTALDLLRLKVAAKFVDEGVPPQSAATNVRDLDEHTCRQLLSRIEPTHTTLSASVAAAARKTLLRAATALQPATIKTEVTLLLREYGPQATWTNILFPLLNDIGDEWNAGNLGVASEHCASVGIASAFAETIDDTESSNARPTLLACAPDEQHTLPLFAIQATLAESGDTCVNLGARVPTESLATSAKRLRPAAIVVWASTEETAQQVDWSALPLQRPLARRYAAGPGWNSLDLPPQVTPLYDLPSAVTAIRDQR